MSNGEEKRMKAMIDEALMAGVALRQQCIGQLDEPLMAAATMMVETLQDGGKILVCGNGGSASDAQHFVAELVNRFEINRPALAAIAMVNDASVITSIANDFNFESVYARQTEALGRKGDVLLGISTSGDSKNVLKAVAQAQSIGMKVVVLTGRDGGALATHAGVSAHININHPSTARVQEMHITCLHMLCTLIDETMFGGKS